MKGVILMKCGFAKLELPVTLPCRLAGYAADREALQQHDPLMATVLVLETEQGRYGYVSLDLIAVHQRFYDIIMKACRCLGFSEETLMLCATHTHAGCMGIVDCKDSILKGMDTIFGTWDELLAKQLSDAVVHTIKAAVENCRKAQYRAYTATVAGIGANRNNPAYKGDTAVFVMEFQQMDGKRFLFLQMSCHPTVLDAANKTLSADLAKAMRAALCGTETEVLFFNGACGDISTRFTRQEAGVTELSRYSCLMRRQMHAVEERGNWSNSLCITTNRYHFSLKKKKALALEEARLQLQQEKKTLESMKRSMWSASQLRLQESRVEGAEANLVYARLHRQDSAMITIPVTVQQLNQETLVFLPLELYSELRNKITDSHIHFICYANGYYLYLCNEEAFLNGYYESRISPFEKGEGEVLMQWLCDIITKT